MAGISEALAIAVGHHQAGRLAEAEEIYRQILAVEPGCAQAWHLLGMIAFEAGRFEAAVELSRRALQLQPNLAEAENNLGNALKALGRRDDARECFRRAIRVKPDFAEGHHNLGLMLGEDGRLGEARACYERAVTLNADFVEAHNNLGTILHEEGKREDAIAMFRRATKLNPNYVEAYNNLGNALKEQGKYAEAAASYRRALELDPRSPEPHVNHARLMLLGGDFENGWREYEWRWKLKELRSRDFSAPQWNGEPLAGKTILLHAEQGLGDCIQFVRYAPIVKNMGATVLVQCQRPLTNLLSTCPGIDELIAVGDQAPRHDLHAALLSLPCIFKTTLNSIPARIPYLFAEPGLDRQWNNKLRDVEGFRIGINWHGRAGRIESRKRDIPLEVFRLLGRLPGVQLISLQKSASLELATTDQTSVLDLGEFDTAHGAFTDSAAIMKNLDLVITSDTSVPHLAGALGVPVWLALPFVPDWRWLLERSDSPWYPTMRLFRQKEAGDWRSVFEEMQSALGELQRS